MCFSEGQPITYREMIPPEQREYRKALYDWVDPSLQVPQYPGPLPYTQPPDYGQMAGMNTILSMLGAGPWSAPQMPGIPGNVGWGRKFQYNPGGYYHFDPPNKERYEKRTEDKEDRDDRWEKRREERRRNPDYDPYRST